MEPRVRVEQECDFDGRAIADPEALHDLSPLAACFDSGGPQHSLVYTGLEGAGPHLAFLTAKVHFSVSSGHKSESLAGPLEVGADGRVYAAVQYPSLRDLWPEIYFTRAVRVAQVDVFVEIQSGPETIRYPGTEFKVTYRRMRTPADDVVLWRPQDVPHTIRRHGCSSLGDPMDAGNGAWEFTGSRVIHNQTAASKQLSTFTPVTSCPRGDLPARKIRTMPVTNPKLGFIGAGMMSSAMINGIIAAKVTKPENIIASDVYQPSLDRLSASGVQTSSTNKEVVSGSDVVVLAVKPDVIPAVLKEIEQYLTEDSLVVSIAAGVPLAVLEELVPGKRVVRVMPNTPCLVSESAAAFSLGAHAKEEDRELVQSLLSAVGYACEVKEYQLDAVTGVSGSGPAYIFVLIEALADGGVRMGLPRATALKLAAQTVRGAATMVLETGTHPAVLKDQVCSPGGTTIAAVEALEKNGFRAAAIAAVVAATTKSLDMRSTKK